MRLPLSSAVVACALALAGCETTKESDWASAHGGTEFDQAEKTCETLRDRIDDKTRRSDFFVKCMAAFDWTPKPGREPLS